MSMILNLTGTEMSAFTVDVFSQKSKLAEGKWVKVSVQADGVYAINKSDLAAWGFANPDINSVRVFGYGGEPLSDKLALTTYIDDLPQQPVMEKDGVIYFYGKSTDSWTSASSLHPFVYQQHPYATKGCYFVTLCDTIPQLAFEQLPSNELLQNYATSFIETLHHEQELTSPGQTGRTLLGEDFRYTKKRTFKFKLTGLESGTKVSVRTRFMTKLPSDATGALKFTYNGTQLSDIAANSIRGVSDPDHEHYVINSPAYTIDADNENFELGIEFSSVVMPTTAALDYISINYRRKLQFNGKPLIFVGNDAGYSIQSDSSEKLIVLDVTEPAVPKQISLLHGEQGECRFAAIKQGTRRYVAFTIASVRTNTPKFEENVENQNLHGEPIPDMVIVTPAEYMSQARRLAKLHEDYDSMRTLVVTQQQVFNEFSSGTADLNATRRMLKMFYDRSVHTSDRHKLEYLALFARGSYDNREITPEVQRQNFPKIFTWQTESGTTENDSYTSDDVYAFLEDNSGANMSSAKSSIAVGRFPVKSLTEVRQVIDKIESYMANKRRGAWKNNILVIADDEDKAEHMIQSDKFISEAQKAASSDGFLFNRLYIDAFNAISNGLKRTYPDAKRRMFERFGDGVLWANYIGHANPKEWTHDGLLTLSDINNEFYYRNLPFLCTATCEFTRWDANEVSGGELMFLNPSGGTVGMISTTRLALIYENGVLAGYIGRELLKKDANGEYQRVGDILKNAKNSYLTVNENRLRYTLIGDPALRLTYPTQKIKVETVNGIVLDTAADMPVLQAGGDAEITGVIVDRNGSVIADYNGTVSPRLYDAETDVETFGYGQYGEKHLYHEHSNLLYLGEDSVKDGRFTINMKIPIDISNNYSPALLNLYATSAEGVEANGSTECLYVYGYAQTAEQDTIAPVIELFGVNAWAEPKGVPSVNENPLVLASFFDDSGINLSNAGIGHKMTLLLDEKTLYDDVVNQYKPTTGRNGGTISYRLSDLTKGLHTLRLKVWDVANNSTEKTITFNVIPGLSPELTDVYTTANPASVEAKFYVTHNVPDAQVDVTIEVFNLLGHPVWSTTVSGRSDEFTSMPVVWDLTNTSGSRVPRGIYIFRASVASSGGKISKSKSKKIAVTSM